ncbi:hypothetical protein BRC81_07795 [Halobacteriales archaeon QS_1_68_20]|nr:MAG: hypothetical protein BRC81_07795 [Halobacteriales archaeon QS_1_68_20]
MSGESGNEGGPGRDEPDGNGRRAGDEPREGGHGEAPSTLDRRGVLTDAMDGRRPNFLQSESPSDDASWTDRVGAITRRGALSALGAGALFGTDFLSTVRGASPKTVEIPALLSGDSVVKYEKVSEDWVQHREQARTAKRKLVDAVGNRPDVFSVGLTQGEGRYGGERGFRIRVQSTDPAQARDLPDSVEDVPVAVESAPESHGPGGCNNAYDEEYAVGGEVVGWTGGGYGTATAAVNYDYSDETYLLHCAHVFWDDCDDAKNNSLSGRGAHRGTYCQSGQTGIGEVSWMWDRKGDYVLIEPDDDSSFWQYVDDNYGYPDIAGRVSESYIDYMASNGDDEPIYSMGATDGRTEGDIITSDVSFTFTCINFRDEGVEATTQFANGDSGGPTWYSYDGDAYITHVNSYRYWDHGTVETCCNNTAQYGNALGTAGYYIQNDEPISFG